MFGGHVYMADLGLDDGVCCFMKEWVFRGSRGFLVELVGVSYFAGFTRSVKLPILRPFSW